MLKRWEQLPQELQNDSVRPYYEALSRKRGQLLFKRVFDILLSLVLLVLLVEQSGVSILSEINREIIRLEKAEKEIVGLVLSE